MSGPSMKEQIRTLEADLVQARLERDDARALLAKIEPLVRRNGYTVAANEIKEMLT